jgi:hypothetical protein
VVKLRRDLIETLKRDLSLIGLMCGIRRPMSTWDFVKYVYPDENSKVILNKEESYLRKVLNRWSSYGIIKKEVIDGRAIYTPDLKKIKLIKKRNYWEMVIKLGDFQINYRIKPYINQTKSSENQTFC